MRSVPYSISAMLVACGGLGFAAQVVLLRELMAVFAGSELTVGIALAAWLLCEAAGAGLLRRRAGPGLSRLVPHLAAVSAIVSTLAVPAITMTPRFLGMLPGEMPGIPALVGATFLILLLPAALHGALFVALSTRAGSAGTAYILEGLGTIAAGILVLPVMLNQLPSTAVVALLCLPLAAVLAGQSRTVSSIAVVMSLTLALLAGRIERQAWNFAWPGHRVTSVTNTLYGKVVRLQLEEQRTVLYDGIPVMNMPPSDIERTEELVHLPLLAHPVPNRVLLVGQALGGSLAEALKQPVAAITALQLDPVLSRELRIAGGDVVGRELADPRVKYIADDPVAFLGRSGDRFDVIILLEESPNTFAAGRLFSVEFFRLCRQRLASDGLLAVPTPGTGIPSSPEARKTLAVRRATLQAAFETTAVIVADFPLLIASDSPVHFPAETLASRLNRRRIRNSVVDSAYVANLLDPFRVERLEQELAETEQQPPSTALRPIEVLLSMARAGRRSSSWLGYWYSRLAGLPYWSAWAVLVIAAITLAVRRHGGSYRAKWSVFSSGLVGAGIYTGAVVAYQMRFGSVYFGVSVLTATFMLGSVLGALLATHLGRNRALVSILVADVVLGVGAALLPVLARQGTAGVFSLLLGLSGACLGFQFSAAGPVMRSSSVAEMTGTLAVLDLFGGAIGGLLAALLLLPAFGVAGAALILVGVKVTSVAVGLACRPAVV